MKKICGVYKITNKINGKVYVGSSNNIKVRIARHKWELRNNIHNNKNLQRSWLKHGESAFVFDIFLECSPDEYLEEEQKIIESMWGEDGRQLYNTAKNTLAPMSGMQSPMKGRKHSKETCEKMAKSHRGKPSPNKGNKYSTEVKEKLSKSQKGKQAGERNSMAILNWEIVGDIRKMRNEKGYTASKISELLEINISTIKNVIYNKRWII